MEIGSILKNARTEMGLTQEQAAEALGVSRQTISNWETGRTYPDIISVIRMSDLYSVSLDRLLKGETSEKQAYQDYLEESTNTVKSREKQSRLFLVLMTLGIWAFGVIAFWLVKDSDGGAGFCQVISWTVMPVLFFAVSWLIGWNDYYGKLKWLAPVIFAGLYMLVGSISTLQTEDAFYRAVVWPDFRKLPLGLMLSLAGLGLGVLLRKREAGRKAKEE